MILELYHINRDAGVLCVILSNTAISKYVVKEIFRSILHLIGILFESWEELSENTLDSYECCKTPSDSYVEEFRSQIPAMRFNSLSILDSECSKCLSEFEPDSELLELVQLFSGFLLSRLLIPIWWRWYYWGSPVAWTIYGLFASQIGDRIGMMELTGNTGSVQINKILKDYWGYDHDFLIPVVFAHVGWVFLFFFVFAYGIKFLNFQRR
ncbi:hypothetical protein ACS0TY_017532 [Phlomoides rotata]